ncbi:deoxyhypusine synthase [Fistulifera solaris]|uniref:deoxyhypusine synthase n=1 Tax=Fistulifera solaris TaxID=1519565 RepID=A0A1Z5KBQ6_FISSO|nr:deoxyhypusine synthase [Fistulifera solaris]|eukprot:GAX23714.1 deoxyhypusine synthase [Fistulifera solaris]
MQRQENIFRLLVGKIGKTKKINKNQCLLLFIHPRNMTFSTGLSLNEKKTDRSINILEAKPLPADNNVTTNHHIPSVSAAAVLGESQTLPADTPRCRGFDFAGSSSNIFDGLMEAFLTTGFQATNLGLAIEQIREMRSWRLSHEPFHEGQDDPDLQPMEIRERIRARIFLAYTSNQISCGVRENLKFLVQHKMVDVIVTTAGGIEEDLIKCFQPTFMGDFRFSGRELRMKGINRIGNLLIPNNNYCEFEDWVSPIIEKMHDEQDAASVEWAKQVSSMDSNKKEEFPERFLWTPSKVIHRLGKEINNPDSVLYWAAMNNIPVFCPALTDGSLGDMLYFHSYKRPGFVLDIAEDIRLINDLAIRSHCTGQIILGGGVVKHHTCNANLMRNGANYSVYINTASEFDGSDSGASPDEAISWGKIRLNAKPVKVTADATIVFPLIVAATFAKDLEKWTEESKTMVCHIDELESNLVSQF